MGVGIDERLFKERVWIVGDASDNTVRAKKKKPVSTQGRDDNSNNYETFNSFPSTRLKCIKNI